MSRKLMGATGLLIALVLLLGINILSQNLLRGARVDLTENKLYTLTEGSLNIIRSLDEPVRLRFYFSERQTDNLPFLRAYATRVRELLMEYVEESNGKLILEVINPEPFSEAEDMAVAAGMQGIPISATDRIYFGLQGISTTDIEEKIPVFTEEREAFLEYDITSLIQKLSNPDLPRLALITGLPLSGSEIDPMAEMMGQRREREPWIIYDILQQSFEVEKLSRDTDTIPVGTDVLLLIHPRELSEKTEYAIDQFVLGGGRVVAFVDPHAEAYEPPQNPSNPMASAMADRGSNIPRLLDAWGVRMDKDKVVLDRRRGEEVNVGPREAPQVARYVAWMNLTREDVNREEFTVSQLQSIRVGTPGFLEHLEDADTEFIPLLRTSEDSTTIATEQVRFFPRPQELLANFTPDSNVYTLAARITGPASTAFPEGIDGDLPGGHLSRSQGAINVIVVADVDLLHDERWVRRQNFFGQLLLSPIANNGDMFINFIDQMSGSSDLISIRGRGGFNRPFTRVQAIQEEASREFEARRQQLIDRERELNARLDELRRGQASGQGPIIVPENFQRDMENYQQELIETRGELRRVNYALRADVEKLGTRLKLYNIVVVPVLIGLIAVGIGIFRAQRRKFMRKSQ